MKKIIIATLLLCAACSKGNGPISGDSALEVGQYLYEDGKITAAIMISDSVGITIYIDGKHVYQELRGIIRETGYSFNSLVLNRTATSRKEFKAYVEHNSTGVDLPKYMDFHKDNRTLDSNGDGVIERT